jgi:hypothetical protein
LLAHAKVDPARVRRCQRGVLFRDDERLVVGQQHTAGAQPDPVRPGGQNRREYGRCRAADASDAVLLPHPEPAVTEVVGSLCHLRGLPERGRSRLTGQLRYDVQHRVS